MLLSRLALTSIVTLLAAPAMAEGGHKSGGACTATARTLKAACVLDVAHEQEVARAVCLNLADRAERRECKRDAGLVARDSLQECGEVFHARRDVCDLVGDTKYDPAFGPAFAHLFVDPTDIGDTVQPNPFFPLVVGTERVYEKTFVDDEGEEVTETVTVTVTGDTKLIDGITCLVVKDIVTVNGVVIEDTDDWVAQDVPGNVWYCGEVARNFEVFDGDDPEVPELVDIDGSWKAGREGAKAGILFPANPVEGDVFRQEVAWGEAEDVIVIDSTSGTETAPAASCNGTCVVTRDFTALSPGKEELKYYAPGVGLIVELDPDGGERLELIGSSGP